MLPCASGKATPQIVVTDHADDGIRELLLIRHQKAGAFVRDRLQQSVSRAPDDRNSTCLRFDGGQAEGLVAAGNVRIDDDNARRAQLVEEFITSDRAVKV